MLLQKDKFLVYAQENGTAVASIILLGSTVALAYNAVHNMLLKRTSSVAVSQHTSYCGSCSLSRSPLQASGTHSV